MHKKAQQMVNDLAWKGYDKFLFSAKESVCYVANDDWELIVIDKKDGFAFCALWDSTLARRFEKKYN